MKAILIARVSTQEQKEAGNSLPAQIARLEKYCVNKGLIVDAVYSFDESAYSQTRTEFEKILDIILSHKTKIAVCCDKVDRLTRNMFDKRISLLYEKALNDEIELHFVSDGQVLNSKLSAAEKFQFSISLGLAKYYSDAVSDNVKRAIEQKLRQGEWIAKRPYGYKTIIDSAGNKNIVPHEYESLIVQKMFELYSSGLYSLKTLALKFETDYGHTWDPTSIAKILERPFYYGEMLVKGQLYPHKYQPIISKDLFNKVYQLKKQYNKKSKVKLAGKPFLYRGMLRCAHCNLAITPERQKGYAYYHCTEYNGKHDAKWLREERITEALATVFKKLQMPQEVADQITATLNELNHHQATLHKQQLNKIQTDQKTLTTMIDNLYLDKLKGRITESEYDKFYQNLTTEQTELHTRLTKLQHANNDYFTTSQYTIQLLSKSYDLFNRSEVDQKRHLINFVLSNLQINDGNVLYELRKPFDLISKCSEDIEWRP
jgi:site-specific DNA recombinase